MTHIVFLRCKMLFTHAAVLAKEPFGAMSAIIIRPRSLSIPGKCLSETEIVIERNAADGLDGGLLRGTPLMLTLVLSSQKVQYKDSGRLSRGITKGVSPVFCNS